MHKKNEKIKIANGEATILTDKKQSLDHHVWHDGGLVLLRLVHEGGVVGDHDGDIKGGKEDNQIPAGLEHPVMGQDEAGFLDAGCFVLRERRSRRRVEEVLLDERQF